MSAQKFMGLIQDTFCYGNNCHLFNNEDSVDRKP